MSSNFSEKAGKLTEWASRASSEFSDGRTAALLAARAQEITAQTMGFDPSYGHTTLNIDATFDPAKKDDLVEFLTDIWAEIVSRYQDFETAKMIAARLLEIEDNAEHHAMMGSSLSHLGRYAEAQEHFETSLDLDPANRTALIEYALLYVAQEKFPQAREIYNRAEDLMPSDFIVLRDQLALALEEGKSARAKRYAKKIMLNVPSENEIGVLIKQARYYYFKRGKIEGVEAVIQALHEMKPDHPRLNNALGNMFYLKAARANDLLTKEYCQKRAEDLYLQAIKNFDDSAQEYYASAEFNLGKMLNEQGRDKALIHFLNACDADCEDYVTHYHLAKIFAEKSKPFEAAKHAELATAFLTSEASTGLQARISGIYYLANAGGRQSEDAKEDVSSAAGVPFLLLGTGEGGVISQSPTEDVRLKNFVYGPYGPY